jgi:hypothetical protein
MRDIEKERIRAEALVCEAIEATRKILAIFPTTTRGLMIFMCAMHLLKEEFPGVINAHANQRMAEWIAVGEPEDVKEVMPRLQELMRERKEGSIQ